MKSSNHFVRNQKCNRKKSHEIIRNHIKSNQSRLQSSILNLYKEGLKSYEILLKSYENHLNHMKITEIAQNYVQSMIS